MLRRYDDNLDCHRKCSILALYWRSRFRIVGSRKAKEDQMSSESEVRSRYLALALDARKVIDALIVFVDKEEREEGLDESLQEVIESLQAKREDIFSPLRNRSAFSEYYEQVRTVGEVANDRAEIVQKLETVKTGQATMEKQKQDAFDAIKLLSAIESRALYYYRPQP